MTIRTTCRICPPGDPMGSKAPKTLPPPPLRDLLSLGATPLADRFLTHPNDPEERYPLDVRFCAQCGLVQLVDIVEDEVLFGPEYAFYTGASPSSLAYFKAYAEWVLTTYPEESNGLIVEIASNDGTLLRHFQALGRSVLGIEPTANTAQIAIDQCITTLVRPFSFNLAYQEMKALPKASLILANNVLAHVDDLHDFVAGIKHLLADDGVAIVEVQYLPHLLFKNAFDHVYHEHRSFFSFGTLQGLFAAHGLTVVDVQEADTQGGSIRVTLLHSGDDLFQSAAVTALLAYEDRLGLTNGLDAYQGAQARVQYVKEELVSLLVSLKAQGKTIYGYGASAKGNTLLNTCGIGTDLLDCIVDTTPFKIGKYAPGSHLPVVAPGSRPEPDYYLLLVWNYLAGVLEREQPYRDAGGKFIVPIPAPIIV